MENKTKCIATIGIETFVEFKKTLIKRGIGLGPKVLADFSSKIITSDSIKVEFLSSTQVAEIFHTFSQR